MTAFRLPSAQARICLVIVYAAVFASSGCATRQTAAVGARGPDSDWALLTPPDPGTGLGLDTPVAKICADPAAKAVLDRDLPGLTSRPEFPMFKMMSLKTLASMSGGKLTPAELSEVQADLAKLPPRAAPASGSVGRPDP